MTFGSLFAGIGGFDLGLERAGMRCRWQVENEPYARRVLAKHWPDVKRYGDITELDGGELEWVDLICGGFPCQDISAAGRGGGIEAARSGLWRDFARVVGEVRPRYVLVENSPALRGRGLAVVLQDLDALGFDAEWHCVPAAAVGAPHLRDRIWIVAYADGLRKQQSKGSDEAQRRWADDGPEAAADVNGGGRGFGSGTATEARRGEVSPGRESAGAFSAAGTSGVGWRAGRPGRSDSGDEGEREPERAFSAADADPGGQARRPGEQRPGGRREPADGGAAITDPPGAGLQERQEQERLREYAAVERSGPADADGEPLVGAAIARGERHAWTVEPGVVRMVYGVPQRVDRIRCLGNAVVPQMAEWLGRAIRKADEG